MDDTAPPKWKRPRLEGPPDVPLSMTSIPFVANLIAANNAEVKPKKRMHLADIVNEALTQCARGGQLKPWWANDDEAEALMMEIIRESRGRHHALPASGVLSRVLYELHRRRRLSASECILDFLLESRELLPEAFRKSVDEKVVVVGLRCLLACAESGTKLQSVAALMDAVPSTTVRRRMYTPILEHCALTGDADTMRATVLRGMESGMEFWDSDYDLMLQSIKAPSIKAPTDDSPCTPVPMPSPPLRVILNGMMSHHPLVGARNAASLKRLLSGQEVVMPASGRCPNCQQVLTSFDYTEEERQTIVQDIMEKLIRPRIHAVSHYQPNSVVDEAIKAKREEELKAFLSAVASMDFNAVIDGANVGYYGLSHWYAQAKRALLTSRGFNVDNVSYGEIHDVPFPVDVAPQFSTIDEMISNVRRLGYRPLVVLHERHTSAALAPAANGPFLKKWMSENVLLPSPGFLNDDYCWLLASVARPSCAIVTNDLMRDHHFGMLSQRAFLRWRQRVRIPYRAFVLGDGTVKLNVLRPAVFATWVQQDLTTGRWHIPFLKDKEVLDQATNKIRQCGDERDDLEKNGGDHCDAWICTEPFS